MSKMNFDKSVLIFFLIFHINVAQTGKTIHQMNPSELEKRDEHMTVILGILDKKIDELTGLFTKHKKYGEPCTLDVP
jgi:hypothetical protein